MVKFSMLFMLSVVFPNIFIWFMFFSNEKKMKKREHAYLNIPPQ